MALNSEPCGCKPVDMPSYTSDGPGNVIDFCPLHEAAGEMLRALRECYTVLAEGSYHNAACVAKAQAAINKAEKGA